MKHLVLSFLAIAFFNIVNAQTPITPTTKSNMTLTLKIGDSTVVYDMNPHGGVSPYLCDTEIYPSDAKTTTYQFNYKLDWYGSIAGKSGKVVHYTSKSGNGLYIFTDNRTYHIPLSDALVTASTWRKTYAWINVAEIGDSQNHIEFQYEQYDSQNNELFDPKDIANIRKLATAIGAKLER